MLSKMEIDEIYSNTVQGSIGMIWHNSNFLSQSYNHHKEIFFNYLEYLLSNDLLKFAKNGEFLSGTIEQQLALFKNAFPEEERMKEIDSYWWYLDDCPVEPVWILNKEIEGFTVPAEDGKFYFWA